MPPSYNVSPSQVEPICRLNEGGQRELAAVKSGLVPSWAKDAEGLSPLINARAETAPESPVFRNAFKSRRCVVPVSGFYEWKKAAAGKQPMYITRADGRIMLLAGLWESWRRPNDTVPLETMTILTTEPNTFMSEIHHRMPVVLDPGVTTAWLGRDTEPQRLTPLLRPAAEGLLRGIPVSSRVNTPTQNDSALCEPFDSFTLFQS